MGIVRISKLGADVDCEIMGSPLGETATVTHTDSELDLAHAEIRRLQRIIQDYAAICKHSQADIARMRLTDAEREALEAAARVIDAYEEEMDGFPSGAAATLRGLLARTK